MISKADPLTTYTRAELGAMTTRQLKHLAKDRGLADGIDLWHAHKDHIVAILTGDVNSLPAYDPRRAVRSVPTVDDDRVRSIVRDELAKAPTTTTPHIEVRRPSGAVILDGVQHEQFANVLRKVSAGIPVLLVGPAGSGKTYLAGQVAKALDVPFTFNSMSAGVTESSLLGRVLPGADGAWAYRPSPFVTTYRQGGVHLFDEVDAADPNLLVIINAAIANGHLSIPFADDMTIGRHAEPTVNTSAAISSTRRPSIASA